MNLTRDTGLWPVLKTLRASARAGGPCHGAAIALLLMMFALLLVGADRATAPATLAVSFRAVDITIDPHGAPLAAYQLEFIGESDRVKLVGIEGGEHAAFKEPPYYDSKALMQRRVILAALNAGDELPKSKTRIARLHLQISGEARDHPNLSTHLTIAATSDGSPIAADVKVEEGERP